MTLTVRSGAIDFLNDQYWHDSFLREITINRTKSYDTIIFVIDLLSDWENNVSSMVTLTFKNCFAFNTGILRAILLTLT